MSDSGLDRLLALADAAYAAGDRDGCLQIHSTISSIECVLVAIDLLRARLDDIAPYDLGPDIELSEPRIDA
jgi:hypothetical protein